MVSPSDREPSRLLRFTFDRCYSVKFGGPNDEALHGHPLDGRGLRTYHAHLVHNSAWIAQERRINSVHEHHSDAKFHMLTHYLFSFHDETLEVLAGSVNVEAVATTLVELLFDTSRQLVSD